MKKTLENYKNKGFTLVELAIVMIVVALVIAALLIAATIIRQARIQKVLNESQQYVAAMATFELKYNALPGDMNYAQSIWGSESTCPDPRTHYVKQETCNGNGDKVIGEVTLGNPPDALFEGMRAWQHLANAGLVKESFTGVPSSLNPTSPQAARPGENTPKPTINGNTFFINHGYYNNGDSSHFPGTTGNIIDVAAPFYDPAYPEYTDYPIGPFMTGFEAFNLDRKIDNGRPGSGKVITWRSEIMDCASTDLAAQAEYVLDSEDKRCGFMIRTGL